MFRTHLENVVGEEVRNRRRMLGMSQRELSEELECIGVYICRSSISKIELQMRVVTDVELYGLAKILRCRMEDLFPRK